MQTLFQQYKTLHFVNNVKLIIYSHYYNLLETHVFSTHMRKYHYQLIITTIIEINIKKSNAKNTEKKI